MGYHGLSPVSKCLKHQDFPTHPPGERRWKGVLRARRARVSIEAASGAAVGATAASRAAEAATGASLSGALPVL